MSPRVFLICLGLLAARVSLSETTICSEGGDEIKVADADVELVFIAEYDDGRDYSITFPSEVEALPFKEAFLIIGDRDSPDFATRLDTFLSRTKSIQADFYAMRVGFNFSVIAAYTDGCNVIHVHKDFET